MVIFRASIFHNQYDHISMSEVYAAVNPTQTVTRTGMSGLVQLAPIAIPLALPLALPVLLHAIHGIAVGGIGVLAATLALGPKGKDLIQSSGAALCKMLPGTEMAETGKGKKEEIDPALEA